MYHFDYNSLLDFVKRYVARILAIRCEAHRRGV